MATTMRRLQISLTLSQLHFLRNQAGRGRVSIAEFLRRLIEREAAKPRKPTKADYESAMSICGIADEEKPLIDGLPVSENVDLYLAEAILPRRRTKTTQARRR